MAETGVSCEWTGSDPIKRRPQREERSAFMAAHPWLGRGKISTSAWKGRARRTHEIVLKIPRQVPYSHTLGLSSATRDEAPKECVFGRVRALNLHPFSAPSRPFDAPAPPVPF